MSPCLFNTRPQYHWCPRITETVDTDIARLYSELGSRGEAQRRFPPLSLQAGASHEPGHWPTCGEALHAFPALLSPPALAMARPWEAAISRSRARPEQGSCFQLSLQDTSWPLLPPTLKFPLSRHKRAPPLPCPRLLAAPRAPSRNGPASPSGAAPHWLTSSERPCSERESAWKPDAWTFLFVPSRLPSYALIFPPPRHLFWEL